MDINSVQNSQTYFTNNLTQEQSEKVNKFFDTLIENKDNGLDIKEEEFKKLSFEEAKALKLKLQESGRILNNEGPLGMGTNTDVAIGNSLLYVLDLTNDDNFNKSLFETMKTKEEPSLYMHETIHNMEYAEGRRRHPWPTLSVEEAQGNYNPLSRDEIKNLDVRNYLSVMIRAYEELLQKLPNYYEREETKQSLEDLKNIQKSYEKNQDENSAILQQYTRNTRASII